MYKGRARFLKGQEEFVDRLSGSRALRALPDRPNECGKTVSPNGERIVAFSGNVSGFPEKALADDRPFPACFLIPARDLQQASGPFP